MSSPECITVHKYFYYTTKSIRELEMITSLTSHFWGVFFFHLSFTKKYSIEFHYFFEISFLKLEKCIASSHNTMFYKHNYILYIHATKINQAKCTLKHGSLSLF